MPAVGGHSQLVMWNPIIVLWPCNIYAKESYGIYFGIVSASESFEVSTMKSGQFIYLLNFRYQFWYYFNFKHTFYLPWNSTSPLKTLLRLISHAEFRSPILWLDDTAVWKMSNRCFFPVDVTWWRAPVSNYFSSTKSCSLKCCILNTSLDQIQLFQRQIYLNSLPLKYAGYASPLAYQFFSINPRIFTAAIHITFWNVQNLTFGINPTYRQPTISQYIPTVCPCPQKNGSGVVVQILRLASLIFGSI